MRRAPWLILALVTAVAIAVASTATARGPFRERALGLRALDGESLLVRLASGRRERVRLLGVDAPARGECSAARGAARLAALTRGRRLTLAGDGTARARDGAGRLLAYVTLADGLDLGRVLVADGAAQVDVWGREFARFPVYAAAQQLAEKHARGLWGACGTDVAVSVTADSPAYVAGAEARYAVSVANRGSRAARGALLTVRPPTGGELRAVPETCRNFGWYARCELGALAGGAERSLGFTARVNELGIASLRAAVRFEACVRAPCGAAALGDTNRDNDTSGALARVVRELVAGEPPPALCDPSYPTICLPAPPPDLDCNDIPFREFRVRRDIPNFDPHKLDQSEDSIGCQFDDY